MYVYIDGTKIEANANKYTWVWKKSCITNRNFWRKKRKLLKNRLYGKRSIATNI